MCAQAVSPRPELVHRPTIRATLDLDHRSIVKNARCVQRLLGIKPEIKEVGEDMGVAPGLEMAAYHAKHISDTATSGDEGGNDRM
jgi:hypothetical protein